MTSRTSPLGTTSFNYDTIRGYLLSESDIYENQISYVYDTWGTLKSAISPTGLSRNTSISWAESSDPAQTLYTILTEDSLSTYTKQFVDYKGRSFKTASEGFEGNIYYTDTRFNQLNQADSTSNLYISSGSPLWNSFTYRSADGRLEEESLIGGASVSYSYDDNTVVKTINGRNYTTQFDDMGHVSSVFDPLGNSLAFTCSSSGGVKTIAGNGGTISYYYNDAGLDTTFVDPSLGGSGRTFNSLGQVTWMKDGNGNEFDFTYDALNRVTRKENSNNTSEYYAISYVASGNGKGQVSTNSYTDGNLATTLAYTYDERGRVRTETKHIGDESYKLRYKYDDAGRLDSITDSNGKKFDYRYDERSYLTRIYFGEELIWELAELDLTERTENLGSNITVTSSFDGYGHLSSIAAGDLFNMSYSFNPGTGNLASRTQKIYNPGGTCIDTLTESFTYDSLYRLQETTGDGDEAVMSYDNLKKERISSKSGAGAVYNYSQSDAFRLEGIDTASAELLNRPDQTIAYTSFNKVDTIAEGDYLINS